MKVLAVFGKHAYGDERRGLSPEFQAFIPALSRIGHDVVLFDSLDRRAFGNLAELNAELLRTIDREQPQIVFFVPFLYEVWLETLFAIKGRPGITSICWTTDDSWKYDRQSKFIAPAFHLITTTYPEIYKKYQEAGFRHAMLTQWAAPADALASPLPADQCSYEVTFIGMLHGDRKKRLEWLARRGLSVEWFGYGSPNGPVSVPRMREIIRQSVISLNFANSRGEKQIKARTFEVPGAGGFLLTEYAPGLERFYRIGEEIDAFTTMVSLEAKIRDYLGARKRRDAIAQRGFERTRDEHTYDARLREVIGAALAARNAWEAAPHAIAPLALDSAFQRHRVGTLHRILRAILIGAAAIATGPRRARRAARRFVFEISWRIAGQKTYMAAGLPGRLFPKD